MKIRLLIIAALILGLSGCSTVYYGTMEKLGVHKSAKSWWTASRRLATLRMKRNNSS